MNIGISLFLCYIAWYSYGRTTWRDKSKMGRVIDKMEKGSERGRDKDKMWERAMGVGQNKTGCLSEPRAIAREGQ